MIRTSVCLVALLLFTGCGSNRPATKPLPAPSKQAASTTQAQPGLPALNPAPAMSSAPPAANQGAFSAPAPAFNPQLPAAAPGLAPTPSPAVTAPAANSTFQLAQQMVLESIDIGPGNTFRPEGGQKIVWLRFDVKSSRPVTVNLASVHLMGSGKDFPVSGVGFGGADPSVQHVIDPGIMQSGTVTTSGPAIGEVDYDTGAKQVMFKKLPSRMSVIFLVDAVPGEMQIEGLPGGKIKVK